jgi:hypothetical protein
VDARGFDEWTRRATNRVISRRAGRRIALGGGIAVLLGLLRPELAAACQLKNGKCQVNAQCCAGSRCAKRRHKCVCKAGKVAIGGRCASVCSYFCDFAGCGCTNALGGTQSFCGQVVLCPGLVQCNSHADCAKNELCALTSCGAAPVCIPLCQI